MCECVCVCVCVWLPRPVSKRDTAVIFTGHLRHNAATLTTTMDAIMSGSGQETPTCVSAVPFVPADPPGSPLVKFHRVSGST